MEYKSIKSEINQLKELDDKADDIIGIKVYYTELLEQEKAKAKEDRSHLDYKAKQYRDEIARCVKSSAKISKQVLKIADKIKKLA